MPFIKIGRTKYWLASEVQRSVSHIVSLTDLEKSKIRVESWRRRHDRGQNDFDALVEAVRESIPELVTERDVWAAVTLRAIAMSADHDSNKLISSYGRSDLRIAFRWLCRYLSDPKEVNY